MRTFLIRAALAGRLTVLGGIALLGLAAATHGWRACATVCAVAVLAEGYMLLRGKNW
jgi:hypothetical protein